MCERFIADEINLNYMMGALLRFIASYLRTRMVTRIKREETKTVGVCCYYVVYSLN